MSARSPGVPQKAHHTGANGVHQPGRPLGLLNHDPEGHIPVSPPECHVLHPVTQATQRSWHGRESKPGEDGCRKWPKQLRSGLEASYKLPDN